MYENQRLLSAMFLVETLSLTDVFVMQCFREIYIDSFRCEWREGGKKLFKQIDERNLENPCLPGIWTLDSLTEAGLGECMVIESTWRVDIKDCSSRSQKVPRCSGNR